MAAEPLSAVEFSSLLSKFSGHLRAGCKDAAVAVSGGPDSMALAWLLSEWGEARGVTIHALTVDHGLRKESAREAQGVAKSLKGWPAVQHTILKWKGCKPKTAIQQAARQARYALMAGYCRERKIPHLFLAHHQDDQAETFLLRLAKGSGLDGLAAMRPVYEYDKNLILLRPFLAVPKGRLVATCKAMKIPFVKDPSNESEKFARVRLRRALEEEGMTAKRLSVTAARMDRAKIALEQITEKTYKKLALKINSKRIVFNYSGLKNQPDEIALRVLIRGIRALRSGEDYLPRMEKIEALFEDLRREKIFRKRTLGGLVFEREDKKGLIVISKELH